MIKEVAFVAIAVSDADRARKFYQETLELKPTSTQMDGAWVEYEIWGDDHRRRLSSGVATVARRNDGRVRSGRHGRDDRDAEEAWRHLRHGEDRNAGLLDGAIPRSRRQQARRAQEKEPMTKHE